MGTPLRNERERLGLTTYDLAKAVGVNQSTIHRVESGKKRPSPDLADRLAKYFKNAVTRDQILFPEEYALAAPTPRKARKAA